MSVTKIVCVVPSCRPEQLERFRVAWAELFVRHTVTLIVVRDGDEPTLEEFDPDGKSQGPPVSPLVKLRQSDHADLFCRRSDVVRNLGFLAAAAEKAEYVLTLDDDVTPSPADPDPIGTHLGILQMRRSLGWLKTFVHHDRNGEAHCPRGMPYGCREQAPIMLSHGVWDGVLDYDGETQLKLEAAGEPLGEGIFYTGALPRGTLAPICGMNVMVRREALPLFYFAPMGPDSGVDGLHRFGDIWMGAFLKHRFDELDWGIYTGGAIVTHTRASDARKNVEQEKLGRAWNEWISTLVWIGETAFGQVPEPEGLPPGLWAYFKSYASKRRRYAELVTSLMA